MSFEDFKFRVKYEANRAFGRAKADAKAALKWMTDNKELVIAFLPLAVSTTKHIGKRYSRRREEHERSLYIWDPRSMSWLKPRRELTDAERREVARRYSQGETKYDILMSMKLL